jgi:hypothetical protein
MNKQAHVHRTAKGDEELQTRAHKLKHNLRYVLLLVDGASTVQQIVEKGTALHEVESSLAELSAEGFVKIGDAPPAGGRDVVQVKEELIAIAKEILGPAAAGVVSKIQAAPDNRESLLEVAKQCKKVVKLTIDEKKADQLLSRCSSLLDTL